MIVGSRNRGSIGPSPSTSSMISLMSRSRSSWLINSCGYLHSCSIPRRSSLAQFVIIHGDGRKSQLRHELLMDLFLRDTQTGPLRSRHRRHLVLIDVRQVTCFAAPHFSGQAGL